MRWGSFRSLRSPRSATSTASAAGGDTGKNLPVDHGATREPTERIDLYVVAPEPEARSRVNEGVAQLQARQSAVELAHRFVPQIPYSLSGKVRVGALQDA
jgi:hypothetical protein